MVAGNAKVTMLTQKLDTFMRVRTVADHVAEAPYFLSSAPLLQILQYGLESCQVAVNVSQNSIAHLESLGYYSRFGASWLRLLVGESAMATIEVKASIGYNLADEGL